MSWAAIVQSPIWFDLKEMAVADTGVSRDGLHVFSGLAGLLLVSLVTRRPVASMLPWLVVISVAIANEAYDMNYEIWPAGDRDLQWAASVHDVWNTVLAPTVLMLLVRFRPMVLTEKRAGEI